MPIVLNGTTGISGNDGSAGAPAYSGNGTDYGVFFPSANTVSISTADTERMRITSTGSVGIGISTPTAPLDVNGTAVFRPVGSEGGEINFYNPDNSTTGLVLDVGATDNPRLFSTRNNMDMQIGQLGGTGGVVRLYTEATERFTVASNGTISVSSNILNLGTASLGTNGYSRLPNGLIFQWGTSASIAQDGSATVTFSLAFTTVYNIVITPIGAINTTSGGSDSVDTVTTSNFVIRHGSDSSRTFYWMAIGV